MQRETIYFSTIERSDDDDPQRSRAIDEILNRIRQRARGSFETVEIPVMAADLEGTVKIRAGAVPRPRRRGAGRKPRKSPRVAELQD